MIKEPVSRNFWEKIWRKYGIN